VNTIRIFLVLFFAGFLAACGPVKVGETSTYVLSGAANTGPASPGAKRNATLLVATPVASSGYDTESMIYVQSPYKLRPFAKNLWVAPPAQMLLPIIAQSIRNTHCFRAVVTPPFSGSTRYVLTLNLLMLQQEFFQPTSQVRLIVQATLTNAATGKVIASRRFEAVTSAPENNPYSGVLAANRAASQVSNQIARFVSRKV
jgi:cholesterol transport system auxiliary component